MGHQFLPVPDADFGGGPDPDTSSDGSDPDGSFGSRPDVERIPKPEQPVLDYQFGDSLGWNDPAPGGLAGVSLMPEVERQVEGLMGHAYRAYRDLDEIGAIDAAIGTAGLAALPLLPAVGGATGAIIILGTVGSAVHGWTSFAVRLAGGSDQFERQSSWLNPAGFLGNIYDVAQGSARHVMERNGKLAETLYNAADDFSTIPTSAADLAGMVVKAEKLYRGLRDLDVIDGPFKAPPGVTLSEPAGVPSSIRKPGGPFEVVRP